SYAMGRTTGTYTGSFNVALGFGVASTTLVSGNHNILIGTSSAVDTPAADTSNFLNIENVINADTAAQLVGINLGTTVAAYPLQVGSTSANGNGAYLSAAGVWTSISDARVKENIRPIEYGLKDLMKLKPVNYEMKDSHEPQIGLIAQEVKKVVPEVVTGSEETRFGLSYDNLVALTVKSIQELKVANDNQTTKLASLMEENKKLRDEVSRLKSGKTPRAAQHDQEEAESIHLQASYDDLPEDTGAQPQQDETRELLMLVIKVGAGVGGLLVIGLIGCGIALYRMRRRA
ncbi:MAG: tail fiber domain-containing protein, partial [Bdellovibrionales bacterium]